MPTGGSSFVGVDNPAQPQRRAPPYAQPPTPGQAGARRDGKSACGNGIASISHPSTRASVIDQAAEPGNTMYSSSSFVPVSGFETTSRIYAGPFLHTRTSIPSYADDRQRTPFVPAAWAAPSSCCYPVPTTGRPGFLVLLFVTDLHGLVSPRSRLHSHAPRQVPTYLWREVKSQVTAAGQPVLHQQRHFI